MQLAFTPVVVVLFAVVAQAVLAAGLLWWARCNQLPNRFLALLMLAIALWLLDGFFRVSGLYRQEPGLYFSPIYYSLAFGPLLYFYVRGLIEADFRWSWRHCGWHFAPVLVQAALYWWLRTQSYDFRNWFWQHVHRPYTYRLEFIGTWVSLTGYLLLSLRRLRQYQRWLADNFSDILALRLLWLRWLLVLLAVVSAQWLIELGLRELFGLYYRYDYSTELLGGVVFIIGLVGLRQADRPAVRAAEADLSSPELPAPTPAPATAPAPAAPAAGRSSPALAAPPVDAAVAERIRRALEDEQLYLNPVLSLAEVAAHTGLAPKLISYTINAGLGRSFNDVVNGLRVAEVQRRLAQPDARRFTLLGIALESGFNSKTTFNRIFKQLTGTAPRDYDAQ
ncbi:MAG: helix-turn-helix domain-containing protein [Janthinobacterium lividum]